MDLDKLSANVFWIGRQLELGDDIFGSKTDDGVGWDEIVGGFTNGDSIFGLGEINRRGGRIECWLNWSGR